MADWFAPAFKAGGPVQSVVNFAEYASRWYDVFVFTGDRDLGELQSMNGITTNSWVKYKDVAQVYYATPQNQKYGSVLTVIKELDPDYVYCNSMFSTAFAVYPMMLKRLFDFRAKLVLAPRGMLKSSALAFKPVKKKLFLRIIRLMGIPSKITFHATDINEEQNIRQLFGQVDVIRAANIPGNVPDEIYPVKKDPGTLSIIFIGRIHPVKNLKFLLDLLGSVAGQIKLTIVGLPEDRGYVNICRQLINSFPERIKVEFAGELPHNITSEKLRQHHILVSPTLGENFGHAIFESLSMGKPVLISDQTPWRNLEVKNAGWDLSLTNPEAFINVLNNFVGMDQREYENYARGAFNFVKEYLSANDPMSAYFKLFPINEN